MLADKNLTQNLIVKLLIQLDQNLSKIYETSLKNGDL